MLSDDRFRALVDAMPDGVLLVDQAGAIVYANRQAETIFGYPRAEMLGQGVELLVPDASRSAHQKYRQAYEHSPRVRPMGSGLQLAARRKDGTQFPCEISLSPLTLDEGTFVVAAVRDITERIRAHEREKTEHAARAAAEQAVALRDEFLNIASHELRAPLTAMLLRLQLLSRQSEKGNLNPEIADSLQVPLRDARRLATLIDQLLDVTRITAGRLALEKKSADLVEITRVAIDTARSMRGPGGPDVRLDAPSPVTAVVDASRIEQVIRNLVVNALKYGNGKPVEISVLSQSREACIAVRDQGIGISPEMQGRIFERFKRAVSESGYEGLGLGLYISRQIVDAHGGTIAVKSVPGEGSEFTVRLPR